MPVASSTTFAPGDTMTVVAVGVLAATLAILCHETLGHGLGCVSSGGRITLLTASWFRCSEGFLLADIGGPLGNVVAGVVAVALLGRVRWGPTGRLLLFMFGALNLFWFMGQLAFESLSHTREDWYWALQSQPGVWRPVGAVVGIGGYVLVNRWLATVVGRPGSPEGAALRLAYAAAAGTGVIAGLMWRPGALSSAFEGLLVLGIAPLGLLGVARQAGRGVGAGTVPRSWIWICAAAVGFGAFLVIQGRGLGSMAGAGLPQ